MRDFLKKYLPSPVIKLIKLAYKYTFIPRYIARKLRGEPFSVLAYPDNPKHIGYKYTLIQICHRLGYRITKNSKEKHHLCIRWQDATHGKVDKVLDELSKSERVINIDCLDISKKHVDRVFSKVFGYSTIIDPLTFNGKIVEKSDANGAHDGIILDGPIEEVRNGKIYQRLIDNSSGDQFVVDMRVPVFGANIPFVFLKYKPIEGRFKLSVKGDLAQVNEVFSAEEMEKCLSFCREMGFDYGELDMARDRSNGRLYILDANNTPTIRYAGYSRREIRWIKDQLCHAFETLVYGDKFNVN